MAFTQLGTNNIRDGSVKREDLDVTTPGSTVIRKIVAGTNITISSTAETGTGDVTINAAGGAIPDWTKYLADTISDPFGSGVNDWSPVNYTSTTAFIAVSESNGVNSSITGLTGGASGRVIAIKNDNATATITLVAASTNSSAANRFGFAQSVTLNPGNVAVLRYKDSTTAWEMLAAWMNSSASGVTPIANGGTGQTTQQAALNALAGAVTANRVLRGNGTNIVLAQVALATDVSGTLPIANGGTGATTQQAAINALAGTQTANRVLRSDGTNTTLSQVALATDVTGTLPIANGGTGLTALPGSTREVLFNNAGALSAAANVEIDNNDLMLALNAAPVTPPANFTKLFCRSLANRMMPAFVGPSGLDSVLQPALFRNRIGLWIPVGNSATGPTPIGLSAVTTVGTATARAIATTNMATRSRRLGYVSAATAAALAGQFSTTVQYTLGQSGTVNVGGFFMVYRFVVSDAAAVAGARMFVGMTNSTAAPTNVEPNSITNCIGVAQLSTSNNLFIVYGGSAAQTAIDLGANFPANTLSADLYELALFNPPGVNNTVYYRVERLNTGQVAEGTLTAATPGTQLPANTTFLGQRAWRCNNATLLAVGLDVSSFYIEADD